MLEMYLARRCFGERRVSVYRVNIRTLPRSWKFAPQPSPDHGERVFAMRQCGLAALDNTPAAALAALEREA